MKECYSCHQIKELSQYQKDKNNKDGYKGQCKECKTKYLRSYVRLHPYKYSPDKWRKYKRRQRQTEEGRNKLNSAQEKYRQKMRILGQWQNLRGDRAEQARRWRNKAENRVKKSAHLIVYKAIKTGTLKRQPCEVCGKEKSNAHHEDYSKPLEVIWLCGLHHRQIHKNKEEVENASS